MKNRIIAVLLITVIMIAALPFFTGTVAEASPDWKQLYFDEIKAAIDYFIINHRNGNTGWLSAGSSKYPAFLTGLMLADLNFDGIPELIMFGDGVSASDQMGIFTITQNNVERIFLGWGNYDHGFGEYNGILLFQSRTDGSLSYRLLSGNGGCCEYWGDVLVTNSTTPMTADFVHVVHAAEYFHFNSWGSDCCDFVQSTFNNREVDSSEVDRLINEIPDGFDRTDYTPSMMKYSDWGLWHDSWRNVSDADIWAFLDSYVSETVLFNYMPSNADVTDDPADDLTADLTENGFLLESHAGQYLFERPADGFFVNPERIREITNPASANKTINDVISSMTSEQRMSGDALDDAALFVERAIRRGASRTISRGSSVIRLDMLVELTGLADNIRDSATSVLVAEDLGLLRELRAGITVFSNEKENMLFEFPDDVSDIGFDSITIESEFVSVTLQNSYINVGSEIEIRNLGLNTEKSGPDGMRQSGRFIVFGIDLFRYWSIIVVFSILYLWSILYIFNHKFKNWVVPVFCLFAVIINIMTISSRSELPGMGSWRVADTIEVVMNDGMNAMISLPASVEEKDTLVFLNANGEPQLSKYNPVTGTIDAVINQSGVYQLREYAVDFIDIEHKDIQMREAITLLASRNIMAGTAKGEFSPDDLITRAEFISAIVRVFDMLDHDAVSGFTDINRSDWYYTAVATAELEGIISGFEDNTFRGNANIPKDNMVVITANLLVEQMGYLVPTDIEAELTRYLDRKDIEQWSEDGVALATQSNILIYRIDGLFAPKSTMTRGDAAIILHKVFNKVW